MLRGEVWLVVWPNDPARKPRPLLIVSNNYRNQARNILDVIVVKLTSLQRSDGSIKPTNPAEDLILTFKKASIIRCASIYSVEKIFLHKKINQLTYNQMREIEQRLKTALDLH